MGTRAVVHGEVLDEDDILWLASWVRASVALHPESCAELVKRASTIYAWGLAAGGVADPWATWRPVGEVFAALYDIAGMARPEELRGYFAGPDLHGPADEVDAGPPGAVTL